ncbi:MAG: hypothetical protein K2G59_00020, partial [Muribaculaceae bacterium]|nr:hypothetical protein [Muribaculaceae bacterium]
MNPLRPTTAAMMLLTAVAAANGSDGTGSRQSFSEFRQSVLSDYASFRENVLKDYARFLENAWVEYDRFKGIERDETPKPDKAPVAPRQTDAPTRGGDLPAPRA